MAASAQRRLLFDFQRVSVLPRWHMAALAGMLLLVAAVPAILVQMSWSDLEAEKRDWTLQGPPCAEVQAPASWARSNRGVRAFRYGDVGFTRSFGAVSCAAFQEPGLWTRKLYRVCQFNHPGFVTVTASGRRTTFQPPLGKPATVTVRDGRASCVVAAWRRL